jgi:hypothetical protein
MMDWICWSRVLLFLFLCSAFPMVWVLIQTDSTSVESSNVVVSQLSIYHMGSDGASSFIYNSDTAPIESIWTISWWKIEGTKIRCVPKTEAAVAALSQRSSNVLQSLYCVWIVKSGLPWELANCRRCFSQYWQNLQVDLEKDFAECWFLEALSILQAASISHHFGCIIADSINPWRSFSWF